METEKICIKFPRGSVLTKNYIRSVARIISGHSFSSGFATEGDCFRVVDKDSALCLISSFFSGMVFEEDGVLVKDMAIGDARMFFNAIASNTPGYSFSLAFFTSERGGNLFVGTRDSNVQVKEFLDTMKKAVSSIEIIKQEKLIVSTKVSGGITA